jgi:pimeloyl-ACP methyl ester carboxylesterase
LGAFDVKQQIGFCTTTDGVRIAYGSVGKGSPIIRTSHWMTHIDHDYSMPIWRHTLLTLSQHHQLISYDARGEGLSQREVGDISFDGWKRDLEAVVEALGHQRFALFGASQGAATAIDYAVRNPDRVTHLILYGGFANPDIRWKDPEQLVLARKLICQGWGSEHNESRQWFTSRFMPDGTAAQFRAFNRMQRLSATPDVAERHLVAAADIRIDELLPRVSTPTIVLHCRDDIVAPVECGEELAAKIPGARFVPLDGSDHLFLPGSSAHRRFAEEVAEFLGDPPPPRTLPGTGNVHDRATAAVGALEGHWMIKLVLLVGGAIGLVLSVMQLSGMLD